MDTRRVRSQRATPVSPASSGRASGTAGQARRLDLRGVRPKVGTAHLFAVVGALSGGQKRQPQLMPILL
jgi:hypothetical protein